MKGKGKVRQVDSDKGMTEESRRESGEWIG